MKKIFKSFLSSIYIVGFVFTSSSNSVQSNRLTFVKADEVSSSKVYGNLDLIPKANSFHSSENYGGNYQNLINDKISQLADNCSSYVPSEFKFAKITKFSDLHYFMNFKSDKLRINLYNDSDQSLSGLINSFVNDEDLIENTYYPILSVNGVDYLSLSYVGDTEFYFVTAPDVDVYYADADKTELAVDLPYMNYVNDVSLMLFTCFAFHNSYDNKIDLDYFRVTSLFANNNGNLCYTISAPGDDSLTLNNIQLISCNVDGNSLSFFTDNIKLEKYYTDESHFDIFKVTTKVKYEDFIDKKIEFTSIRYKFDLDTGYSYFNFNNHLQNYFVPKAKKSVQATYCSSNTWKRRTHWTQNQLGMYSSFQFFGFNFYWDGINGNDPIDMSKVISINYGYEKGYAKPNMDPDGKVIHDGFHDDINYKNGVEFKLLKNVDSSYLNELYKNGSFGTVNGAKKYDSYSIVPYIDKTSQKMFSSANLYSSSSSDFAAYDKVVAEYGRLTDVGSQWSLMDLNNNSYDLTLVHAYDVNNVKTHVDAVTPLQLFYEVSENYSVIGSFSSELIYLDPDDGKVYDSNGIREDIKPVFDDDGYLVEFLDKNGNHVDMDNAEDATDTSIETPFAKINALLKEIGNQLGVLKDVGYIVGIALAVTVGIFLLNLIFKFLGFLIRGGKALSHVGKKSRKKKR